MKISIEWKEKMQFEAANDNNEYKIPIDSTLPDVGGEGRGTTPKHLFLQSIAGCTAMDVVHILTKMRASLPERFAIHITGEVAEVEPKVFTDIEMVYIVEGDIDKNKLIRAVTMSQETYCALSIMVKKITDFSYRVMLNGEEVLQESGGK